MINKVGCSPTKGEEGYETQIQDIPPEIIAITLGYLPIAEIGKASLVQRQWNALKNDAWQNPASFFGYNKSDGSRETFLKEMFAETKNLCDKGMIPERLMVYHDEEKTKIAYEQTLANCRNLTNSEIVRLISHENFFDKKSGLVDIEIHPRFTHYLLKFSSFAESTESLDQKSSFIAMRSCIESGSKSGAETLLKCGIDSNLTVRRISTNPFLITAIQHGQKEIVDLLFSYQADPHVKNVLNRFTSLHAAAIVGNAQLVAHLLSLNLEINATTRVGFTPLHMAAYSGDINTIQLLLTTGATLQKGGPGVMENTFEGFYAGVNNSVKPSFIASLKGHNEAAELLKEWEKRA